MIKLTKLNDEKIYLNHELIEFIECTPDTIISLTTGRKVICKDTIDDIIESIISFKTRVNKG